MILRHSFDDRFVSKINELKDTYGTRMFDVDGIGADHLDINQFAKRFFSTKVVANVSMDGNANIDDDSVLSFEFEFNKALQKLNGYYVIWKKLMEKHGIKRANKILELMINGALKVHDQHMLLKPYCYAFSLEPLVQMGLPFIKKLKIGPPKHFSSFINLTVQATAFFSNQLAGACAFPDIFVYMDWYARKDFGDNYLDDPVKVDLIQQDIQSLIYSWNYPFRGSQSAFVNVNLYDEYFLNDLFKYTLYPDGSRPNMKSIQRLQEFYMRWFIKESQKQTFTFPINTATFYKDDNGNIQDEKFLDLISELNCINGTFNIFTGPLGVLSSCCRLRNDTNEAGYTNSFGAGGTQIGSHRVVTLNLPRIAYQNEDESEYMKVLDYNVKAAQDILDIHREIISKNIENGKLPLYTHKFMNLDKQFSTIGFIGLNETCELMGSDILSEDGSRFARSILDKINQLNKQRSKEDGHIRNMEQIPGESAAIHLAKKDSIMFTDTKYTMYANQYIPLWKNVDVQLRIKAQGLFDSMCGGGAICHLNVNDSITKDQMKSLIVGSAEQGVIYFAINIAQSRCNNCGKLFIGKFDTSPCHNSTMTHYLRVVGFLTPVEHWIPERREEYKHRQFYGTDVF